MTRDSPATIEIASSERAMVPFTVIAVLVLLVSLGIVFTLETRQEGETIEKQGATIELTEASAQAEVRDAVRRGTAEAATTPVTNANDDTALGQAIDGEDTFENFTKVLIYERLQESIGTANQTTSDGIETGVRLEHQVDNWNDEDQVSTALDGVEIRTSGETGRDGDEIDRGVIEVRVDGVEIVARQDGEVYEDTSRDVTVHVGTTLFEFHEMAEEYDESLSASVTGGGFDSFTGRLTLGLYGMAYTKTYYDRLGLNKNNNPKERTFETAMPHSEVELLANYARFSAQEQVFGVSDPYSDRVMRGPMLCAGWNITKKVGDDHVDTEAILGNISDSMAEYLNKTSSQEVTGDDVDLNATANSASSNVDNLCDSPLLFGDATGEMGELDTEFDLFEDVVMPMFGQFGVEEQMEQDIYLLPIAELAYYEMGVTDDDLQNAGDFLDSYDEDAVEEYFGDVDSAREGFNQTDQFNETYIDSHWGDIGQTGPNVDTDNDEGGIGEFTDEIRPGSEARNVSDVLEEFHEIEVSTDEQQGDHPQEPDDADFELEEPDDPSNWTESTNDTSEITDTSVVEIEHHGDEFGGWSDDVVTVHVAVSGDIERVDTWEHDEDPENNSEQVYDDELDFEYVHEVNVDGTLAEGAYVEGSEPAPEDPLAADSAWAEPYDEAIDYAFGLDAGEDVEDVLPDNTSESFYQPGNWGSQVTSVTAGDTGRIQPNGWGNQQREALETDLNVAHFELTSEVDPETADMADLAAAGENESPFRDLGTQVENVRDSYRSSAIENPGDPSQENLLAAEARDAYYGNVLSQVENIADNHEEATSGIADASGFELGFVDSAMSDLQGLTAADIRPDPASAQGSPLLNDVTYQVNGYPSYLGAQNMTRADVPAVRTETGGLLDVESTEGTGHAPLEIQTTSGVGWPGFPLIPWPGLYYINADVWQVDVEGEYPRFEIAATSGTGSSTSGITYVRQPQEVSIDGTTVGTVEPITIDATTWVVGLVPSPQVMMPQHMGVGDTWALNNELPQSCTDTYGHSGPNFKAGEAPATCDHPLNGIISTITDAF